MNTEELAQRAKTLDEEIEKRQVELKSLQAQCSHTFSYHHPTIGHFHPEDNPTKVPGVFRGEIGNTGAFSFLLKCRICCFEFQTNVSETCPQCFASMEQGERELARKYDDTYRYGEVELRKCPKCGMALVVYAPLQ